MDTLISKGIKADLTFTSPPYNMRTRVSKGKYTTRENSKHFSKKYDHFDDALTIDDYYDFHKEAIEKMMEISNIVLWNFQVVTGSKEAIFKLIGHFHKNIKDIIVWDKGFGQPAMHNGILNRGSELILVFEKNAKVGRCFEYCNFDRGTLQDIWRVKRVTGNKVVGGNSAVFPIELVEMAINNFSPEQGTVLDPFMGSGTTGIAALNNSRNFIGIELSHECFQSAKSRIKEETTSIFDC